MNILLSLILVFISIGELKAQDQVQSPEVTVDIYLTRAGWAKQDGGYTDPETNLIWGPEVKKMSWGEAKEYCNSLTFGGRDDWRLPTLAELQRSVCKTTGYTTRTACPQPRDHQKDLWLLNKKMEKNLTYWAGDVIQGDPYDSYYFVFDVEGQYVITSKGDKSKARCVTVSKVKPKSALPVLAAAAATPAAGAATTPAQPIAAKVDSQGFTFYIAPFVGVGGLLNNAISMDNYTFFAGELRMGFKVADKFMIMGSADTGFNIRDKSYPVLTTITAGGEYFFLDTLSGFAGLGVGILTANALGIGTATQTNAGFEWKAGATWQIFRWGDKNQYAIPISGTYTGVKTQWVTCHMLLVSIGFMYFN